jgi:hypothetical protein
MFELAGIRNVDNFQSNSEASELEALDGGSYKGSAKMKSRFSLNRIAEVARQRPLVVGSDDCFIIDRRVWTELNAAFASTCFWR